MGLINLSQLEGPPVGISLSRILHLSSLGFVNYIGKGWQSHLRRFPRNEEFLESAWLKITIISVSSNAGFLRVVTNGRVQVTRDEAGISYLVLYLNPDPPFNQIRLSLLEERSTFFLFFLILLHSDAATPIEWQVNHAAFDFW